MKGNQFLGFDWIPLKLNLSQPLVLILQFILNLQSEFCNILITLSSIAYLFFFHLLHSFSQFILILIRLTTQKTLIDSPLTQSFIMSKLQFLNPLASNILSLSPTLRLNIILFHLLWFTQFIFGIFFFFCDPGVVTFSPLVLF